MLGLLQELQGVSQASASCFLEYIVCGNLDNSESGGRVKRHVERCFIASNQAFNKNSSNW